MTPDRYAILEAAPVAPDAEFVAHMTGFVDRFVEGHRKDRWRHTLVGRAKRAGRGSARLYADLDRRRATRVEAADVAGLPGVGVFWDFRPHPPRLLTAAQAVAVGEGDDSVFSLVPGVLAVYFFHEYEVWLCRG